VAEAKFHRLHIAGFDEALGEGIPAGHVVLLVGPPGTMKSSIAYNFLYQHARAGLRGVYLTLEQSRDSLDFQMRRMGLPRDVVGDLLRMEDLARIRLDVLREEAARAKGEQPWLDVLQRHLESLLNGDPLDLLVIDSLPVLEVIGRIRDDRVRLFQFFGWLRELDVTALVISEASHDVRLVRDEEFLADGVITLDLEKVGELDVYRRIRCVKMRGIAHETNVYTLEFADGTFRATQAI
jgi:KaiC/GvpD/RAD55 family RecA-like ATPase